MRSSPSPASGEFPVLVDPKERDFSKYAGATTICPNLQELGLVTGVSSRNLEELLAAAQKLVRQLGIDYMTVTMSEKGIRILYPDAVFHSPTRAREVFDVTGAGDTVIATMAASLAAGLDPETAVTCRISPPASWSPRQEQRPSPAMSWWPSSPPLRR